jgi:hypothetical protein
MLAFTLRRTSVMVASTATLVLVVAAAGITAAFTFTRSGGAVTAVRVVSANDGVTTLSSTWKNVPDSSMVVKVADGQRALLLITFSASSVCHLASTCYIRAVVDGTNLATPGEVIFDKGPGSGAGFEEAHSMQFASENLGSGDHQVVIQYRVRTTDEEQFFLRDRTLTVLRSKVV